MTEETTTRETHDDTALRVFRQAQRESMYTRSVHAGAARSNPHHALIDPIYQTATYTFDDMNDVRQFHENHLHGQPDDRLEYGRYGNPTVAAAEQRVAQLEGAQAAVMFASGMAAISALMFGVLSASDHVILTDDCYRRTRQLVGQLLPRWGITCSVVPFGDYAALEAAIQPNTRLLLSETPTNPYLRVLDVERFSDIARRHNVLSAVDSTFATPINLRPLEWGIDLVLHSGTKYLAGHNDLLCGFAAGSLEHLQPLRDSAGVTGAVADPHNAWLLSRGLKTLALRVAHHNQSGQAVADFLACHPAIERVWYPGLSSHPDHPVAIAQMQGYGGVVSFEVRGDAEETSAFIDRLRIPYISPSLGGPESLVIQPAIMSYYEYTPAQRQAIGIKDNLVRLALGLEDPQDIIFDLERALEGL